MTASHLKLNYPSLILNMDKGYATKLLNYVISNYGNSYSLYLMVLKSNKLAIDFYRKKGFLFVNKFKNTYICKLN